MNSPLPYEALRKLHGEYQLEVELSAQRETDRNIRRANIKKLTWNPNGDHLEYTEAEKEWLKSELLYSEQNTRTVRTLMALIAEYRKELLKLPEGESLSGLI